MGCIFLNGMMGCLGSGKKNLLKIYLGESPFFESFL